MHEIIMGYQGEMSLKGLNRNQFESAMMKILRYRLKTVGKFKVYCTQSTFYMEPEEEDVDMDLAFDRVSKVFGLAALSRAVVCDKDFDTICQTAEDYLGASLHGIRTFKVEARRSDKTYPMTSPELMRELGAYLLGKHNYLKVDVHNPDFKVIVEIRDYGAYIHGPKVPGEGGLPVGTSGRALNMLSGGIDSPVAAYRMAKRGLALDHIHFASPPYTSERAKLKVKALAQLTSIYTGSSNLFVVPYTKPQEYIRDNAPDVLFTVLMRRSMMRIANVIAKKQGCESLDAPVTGGDVGARDAKLSIFVGGDNAAYERVLPCFNKMGTNILHCGGAGFGQKGKLANQAAIAGVMISTCESFLFAQEAGLDVAKWMELVVAGSGGSFAMNTLGRRMLKGDFAPGFFIDHFIKDLGLCLDECRRMKLVLPGITLADQLYRIMQAKGQGSKGTQALVECLAELSAKDWRACCK